MTATAQKLMAIDRRGNGSYALAVRVTGRCRSERPVPLVIDVALEFAGSRAGDSAGVPGDIGWPGGTSCGLPYR